jgi:hypothetical protein
MKTIKELELTFNNSKYIIKKTYHLTEHRTENKFSRAEFLDDKRYKEIIRYALINGLNSFRDKRTVVTVPNFEGKYFSILLELNTKNVVTLISVFHKKFKFWKSFNKCQNRINIFNSYVVPKMSSEEHYKKQFEKISIDRDLYEEDEYFKNAFKQNIRKI